MWDILQQSDAPEIVECFDAMYRYKDIFIICGHDVSDYIITNKFRGIDPWVKVDDKFTRLTELDEEYRKEYERVQVQVIRGWGICFNETHRKQHV